MKQFLLLLSAFLVAVTAEAKSNVNDTIIVDKPNRVTVVTTDSLQSIRIEGKKDDPNYTYQNKIELTDSNYTSTEAINSKDFSFSIGSANNVTWEAAVEVHFFFGLGGAPGMPGSVDVKSHSTEIGFGYDYVFLPWKAYRQHALSVGMYADWRYWRTKDNYRFMKTDDAMNVITGYPEGAVPNYSRIMVLSCGVPLMYHYIRKNIQFGIGPVINFNASSSIRTKYKLDGHKVKEYYGGVHPTAVTVDFLATIKTRFLGVYFKYSPCSMLDGKYGLKFKTFSFGLCL